MPQIENPLKPVKLTANDLLHVDVTNDEHHFLIHVTGAAGKYASPSARRFIEHRFHEFKRLTNGQYQVPLTDNSLTLFALWGKCSSKEQIIYTENAKYLVEWLNNETQIERYNQELIAKHKAGQEIHYKEFAHNEGCKLAEYQAVAATCGARSSGYLYLMEQGTGKTPTTIAAICRRAEQHHKLKHYDENGNQVAPPLFKVIIVCPKNVRRNWLSELERFATVEYKATVLEGDHIKRVRTFIDAMIPDSSVKFSAVVMSYGTMVAAWDVIKSAHWDYAILDEIHYIKSSKTKRGKVALELRDRSEYRLGLTGTPVSNTAIDLFMLFEFVRKGGSGFSSFSAFRKYYGVFTYDETDRKKLVGIQNLPFMQERLSRLAFIVDKKTALPYLPDKMYDIREVEMSKEQEKVYMQVATQLYAEIEDELSTSENQSMTINNTLTRLLRLAEITSGYCKYDGEYDEYGEVVTEGQVYRFDDNPKLEELIDIIKNERSDQSKVLVWSCFTQNIRTICARLDIEGIKHVKFTGSSSDKQRAEAEHMFNNDDDTVVFVGNPAAGGTGLNLLGYPPGNPEASEMNADHVIYYSQNWSHPFRSQSEDRAHRRGTRVPVRITDLCVPATIDEEIRTRVTGKRELALKVKDIREILSRVLKG